MSAADRDQLIVTMHARTTRLLWFWGLSAALAKITFTSVRN